MNVILPPVLNLGAFGNKRKFVIGRDGKIFPIDNVKEVVDDYVSASAQRFNRIQRPEWLTLHGKRLAYPIDTRLCHNHVPCLVESRYIDESDDAVNADRYAFTEKESATHLYLYPGSYRLHATDVKGKMLSERIIQVGKP